MTHRVGNLFSRIPEALAEELFEPLVSTAGCTLERILSMGQASPAGHWYDQPRAEWVVVLRGRAGLRFEGEGVLEMGPGDYVWIPAHCRHRVEWTAADQPTVWLALHVGAADPCEER